MSNPYTNSSEYGKLPEDYPVLREYDTPPVSEGLAEEYVDAAELQAPAPEITPPGSFVSEQPRSRRRIKKLMFAVAAACIMFVAFRPFGLFKGASVTPGAAEIPAIPGYTETVPEPGGPSIGINYAFLEDDGQITFSYFVAAGELFIDPIEMKWASPVTVEIKAVDGEGHESVPPFSPDVWEGSRSMFDYSVDASPLSGDMMLVLTGHYTFDGTEREIVATKNVVPRPPAPNTGADAEVAVDETTGVYTLDYKGYFDPQDSDKSEYDLEVWQFYMNWYDESGNMVGSEGHVAYDDNGDLEPEMVPDGDGWLFIYDNIARLDYAPSGVKRFSVGLTLIDRNTALTYEIETPVMDIPEYVDESAIPVCEILAFSCWSEMYCDLEFSDMDTATKVTFEVWDPNLNTLEMSTDITNELRGTSVPGTPIPSSAAYSIKPFTTDLFVENHADYYTSDKPFPMESEYHVVIDYRHGMAESQVTYIANTTAEAGFYVKYVPDKYKELYSDDSAGTMGISTGNTEEFPNIYFLVDQPELVTSPEYMSITIEIDGKRIPASDIEIYPSDGEVYYGGDATEPVISHFETAIIRRPEGINEGEGKYAVIYLTHYLSGYDRAVTTKLIVNFTEDEAW